MKRGFLFCLRSLRPLLPLILLSVAVSCRTVRSSESVNDARVQYISLHTRDSIFLHDSVRVRESADTVFITRIRTHYRDRMHTDTLWMHDTVTKVVREVVTHNPESPTLWSTAAVLLLILLLLWRSGVLSLLRRLFEKNIK